MYKTDERVQQQQLTQLDLIVSYSADSQCRMTVNTHAAKVISQVQAYARATGTVNRDQYVGMSLTALSNVSTMLKTKVYFLSNEVNDCNKHGIKMILNRLSCIEDSISLSDYQFKKQNFMMIFFSYSLQI